MWAGFICRQDVSITIFGRTKEFSEVRSTSLMCNFGVPSRFLDVIYGARPPNGSPDDKHTYFNPSKTWDKLSNYKTKNWTELSWAKLPRAHFYVGGVGIWAELSCTLSSDESYGAV